MATRDKKSINEFAPFEGYLNHLKKKSDRAYSQGGLVLRIDYDKQPSKPWLDELVRNTRAYDVNSSSDMTSFRSVWSKFIGYASGTFYRLQEEHDENVEQLERLMAIEHIDEAEDIVRWFKQAQSKCFMSSNDNTDHGCDMAINLTVFIDQEYLEYSLFWSVD